MSLVLGKADPEPFVQVCLLLLMTYIGLIVGANEGRHAQPGGAGRHFRRGEISKKSFKILDTSVIIDGRIADIAETGFLDGVLVIPQFVLRELQLVADSADSMKRNRGRRGLDILQRMQKMAHLNVQIVEEDFPHVREVDMKLIELAKVYDCKVVTNDFNLNKVAQLHGVEVLNINELANSLKPIVLPGETMRVFILKEGKEYNQGVAYLDDGTMVVVDNAKRMISKTIDISVTSVLQTTAGQDDLRQVRRPLHLAGRSRRRRRRERHDRPARKSDPQPMTSLAVGENHDRIVDHMRVAVILPAAGLGTRMGRRRGGTNGHQPQAVHAARRLADPGAHGSQVRRYRRRRRDRGRGARRRHGVGGGDARRRVSRPACAWWRAATAGSSRWRTRSAALAPGYRSGGRARCGAAVHRPGDHSQGVRRSGRDRRGHRGRARGGYGEAGEPRHRPRAHPRHAAARKAGAGADAAGVPLRLAGARVRSWRARTASSAPTNPAWWSGWTWK